MSGENQSSGGNLCGRILTGTALLLFFIAVHSAPGWAGTPAEASTSFTGIQVQPVAYAEIAVRDLPEAPAENTTRSSGGVEIPLMPVPGNLPIPEHALKGLPDNAELEQRDGTPQADAPALAASFEAFADTSSVIPPDTDGVAGPSHLMVALNDRVGIQNKAGGVLSTQTLNSFWSSLGVTSTFDPKVVYDTLTDRFVFVSCAQSRSAASSMLLGVSASSDPTGSWYLWQLDGDASDVNWVDFPSIGVNKNWITITANMFTISGNTFAGENIWAIDVSTAIDGGSITSTLFYVTGIGGTVVPALTYSATEETHYLLSTWGVTSTTGYLRLFKITGTGSAPTFTATSTYPTTSTWSWTSVGATQAGSANTIDSGDPRMRNVELRNGALWCTWSGSLPYSTPTHTGVLWASINPATGSATQYGVVDDYAASGMFYYYPSIAVNEDNEVLIGFAGSSSSTYVGGYYTYRNSSTATGTMESVALLKAGEQSYYKTYSGTRNRWGDYSMTCVDPADDNAFWTIQEYADTPANMWSTWWGKVQTSPAISVSPGSHAFSGVEAGECATTTFDVSNTGTGILIGTATTASPFSVSGNASYSLGAGQSTSITIQFCPANEGDFSDTVDFSGGAGASVNVTGTGITYPLVDSVAVASASTVDVTFSEAMGSGVTTAANYALTGTGKGTLSTNPNSVAITTGNTYRLTWTSGEMLDGGNITITVSGVQDGVGNAIGSPNSGTHTGGGIGVAPTVQAVAVAGGTTVDVTFSEAMGTGVTTAANYALSGSGQGSMAATPNSVANAGGNTYRLTWTAGEMLDGGDITISVSSVQDSAGNAIGSPDNGTDTGGGIGVAPAVQSVAVASGTEVDVSFSEAMGTGVLTAANYGLSGSGQGSLSAVPDSVANTSGNTFRLTWSSGEMLDGGDITITVSGAQDSAGNAIGAQNNGTDTGGGIGVAPTVQTVVVASGTAVDVTFSEAMGNGVLTAANYALSGSGQGSLPATADSVVNTIGDTYRLTWNTGEMAQGGDVTITVTGVQDGAGNAIGTPNSGTDTGGGSGSAPTVQSVAVVNGTEVDVTFSEAMGNGVTTTANYTLSGPGQGSLAATPDSVANTIGDTYRLTWSSGEMVDGGDVTITVANAQDLAGNAVGAPDSGTDFGGGVGTAPTVTLSTTLSSPTSTSPIPVTVEFSETVTGFTLDDVQTVNGSAGNFQGSLDAYSFDLTPTAQGTIESSLLSGAGNDAAGNPSESASFSHVFLVASTLELDQTGYSCGESVSIALYDFDLQGVGTQSVTVSSDSGDSETVSLSETASPGHFEGAVTLDFGPATPGDATLQINSGGILTATYHDLDNGAGGTDDITDTATASCLDFGDAPDTYSTTLASNGARHGLGSGLYLGAAVDGEADGAPSAGATGDDSTATDDEDGVSFTSSLAPGIAAGLNVTASAAGKLDAWVDFNVDGDVADAGEQVFTGQTLAAGLNALVVNVPSNAVVTVQTYARFRCSSAGGLSYNGSAADGEVEDHAVAIEPAPVIEVTYVTQGFGTVELGSCATRTFVVKNVGGAVLNGAATVALPFEVTANAAYSLATQEEAAVTVDFCPDALGNFSATLAFTGGGGYSVSLSGSCEAVTPDTWVDFGNSGAEDGTQAHPYNTLAEGISQAAAGGDVRIVAGQTAEKPRITKRLKLNAEGGTVRLGDGTAKLLKDDDPEVSSAATAPESSGLEAGNGIASRGTDEPVPVSGGHSDGADTESDSEDPDTAESGATDRGLNPALEPTVPSAFGGCTCPGATGGVSLRELLEQLFVLGVALGAGSIWRKR